MVTQSKFKFMYIFLLEIYNKRLSKNTLKYKKKWCNGEKNISLEQNYKGNEMERETKKKDKWEKKKDKWGKFADWLMDLFTY